MQTIQPNEPLIIAGVVVGPDDQPVTVGPDAAGALIDAGQAREADDLDHMTVAELRALAATETVALGDDVSTKSAIGAAIRAHRAHA